FRHQVRRFETRQMRTLQTHFDLEMTGSGPGAAQHTWELIQADGAQNVLGLGTVADGVWHLARFKSPDLMAKLASDHSSAWHSLGVSILHKVVVEKLLPEAGFKEPRCRYVHLLR